MSDSWEEHAEGSKTANLNPSAASFSFNPTVATFVPSGKTSETGKTDQDSGEKESKEVPSAVGVQDKMASASLKDDDDVLEDEAHRKEKIERVLTELDEEDGRCVRVCISPVQGPHVHDGNAIFVQRAYECGFYRPR
jgi:hypothetical protein